MCAGFSFVCYWKVDAFRYIKLNKYIYISVNVLYIYIYIYI